MFVEGKLMLVQPARDVGNEVFDPSDSEVSRVCKMIRRSLRKTSEITPKARKATERRVFVFLFSFFFSFFFFLFSFFFFSFCFLTGIFYALFLFGLLSILLMLSTHSLAFDWRSSR